MKRAARLVLMMVRPPVAILMLLSAALGMAASGRANAVSPLFTTVLVILAGWLVNATVLNDLSDYEIDRVNLSSARGRPLVSGDATRRELLLLGLLAGATSMAVAWTTGWRVGLVVTAGMLFNVVYSIPPIRLSARGFTAVVVLPFGFVVVPFLVGAFAVGPAVDSRAIVLMAALYVAFIGRVVLKDFRDVRGDAIFGKRTFLLRHGRRRTCTLSAVCWIAGSMLLVVAAPLTPLAVAVVAACLACALHGLNLLARTEGYAQQQVIIGGIAHMGRGICITVLAALTMSADGWTASKENLIFAVVGAFFVESYIALIRRRDEVPAAAIRPY